MGNYCLADGKEGLNARLQNANSGSFCPAR
jgi:hypothetical protein